jgi:hypothetical protein
MLTDDDVIKLIEAMKPVFVTKHDLEELPTAEQLNKAFQNAQEHTDARFDKIENILNNKQEKRIEKLETQMTRVLDALAMK